MHVERAFLPYRFVVLGRYMIKGASCEHVLRTMTDYIIMMFKLRD